MCTEPRCTSSGVTPMDDRMLELVADADLDAGVQDGSDARPTQDGGTPEPVDPARQAVLNRVRRAQGQLGGVLRMLEQGRDPQAVLHQIKAVSRALDRAGFALVAQEWRDRVSEEAAISDDQLDDLEKLFLSLS